MQVEMPTSNRSKVCARSARGFALRSLLSMTIVLVFCLSSAQAQNDPAGQPQSGETSATTAPAATGKGGDRLSTLRAQIEAAKSDAERARLQRTLVDYLVALGRRSEAVTELRVMSRAERLDPIGFYNIGNALARLGDTDSAIITYRKAIKQRHGNYARALNNLGVLLLRQGRWDEAQEALSSALKLENFRYSEASYNLGRLYSARGEADLAIREWSRALAVQPDHADAVLALARAYAEDGSPERGIAVLDAFIARRGPSADLTDARREILAGNSEGEEAKTVIESTANATRPAKAANVNPPAARNSSTSNAGARDDGRLTADTSSNASARPSSNVKSGGGKRATERLRPLTVDRETYDLLRRARAAREGGRNEEAAEFYRRVLSRSNGFFPPANIELSFVLSDLHRYDEAAESLAMVANSEGARYPITYYHLGRKYELLGRFSLAAEAYEKAAAAYGDANPQFLLDLSRVREKEGNSQAALAAMEAYVRISQSLGRVPEWSSERLAQLRQKIAASSAQAPTPKQ